MTGTKSVSLGACCLLEGAASRRTLGRSTPHFAAGFICTVAAVVAATLDPACAAHFFPATRSPERGFELAAACPTSCSGIGTTHVWLFLFPMWVRGRGAPSSCLAVAPRPRALCHCGKHPVGSSGGAQGAAQKHCKEQRIELPSSKTQQPTPATTTRKTTKKQQQKCCVKKEHFNNMHCDLSHPFFLLLCNLRGGDALLLCNLLFRGGDGGGDTA